MAGRVTDCACGKQNMETIDMRLSKISALAGVAALGLGLAACSGGSGGGSITANGTVRVCQGEPTTPA
jgi:hypothetical protein